MSSTNGFSRSMGRIVKIIYNKSGQIDLEQVNLACNFLNKGGVIAVPTDTIYGLAAKVDDSKALDKIYKIKGRDSRKPLAVCLSSINDINEIADTKELNQRILQSLLPGPITILLKRNQGLNHNLNPGSENIGVRVPDHNFIMALCRIVGPLALTSANRSGESSPIVINDFSELWSELDCVFDNGILKNYIKNEDNPKNQRLGSTVVDLSRQNIYTIIREGCALNRTVNLLNRFGYKNTTVEKIKEVL